jgi:hypothetical protein
MSIRTRFTRAPRVSLTAASALIALAAAPLAAQIRASEPASVSQTIDGTKITIEYSRPRLRGRKEIFGTNNVKWNETWTPGANYATTLDASNDISLDGHAVPKGKYSVWMVVRKSGPWTFVLDPRVKLFHTEHPDSTAQQIRFPVKAQNSPVTEVLTWSFPEISITGATIEMAWVKTRVTVNATVKPSLDLQLSAADAAPYVGRYVFEPMTKSDSLSPSHFNITHENGVLKGEFDPVDSYMKKFALIRVAPDLFAPGIYDEKGALYEVLRPDLMVEFTRTNGAVSAFEMRDDQDKSQGKATRVP